MTKAKTNRENSEPAAPPVLLFKEKTFDHDGLIATRIEGVIHFIDRSYARGVGIVERNVSTIVEDTRVELELYGSLHVAHDMMSVVGKGAKRKTKAFWLNGEQFMIMLMKSSSPTAIEFRHRVVMILRDLREGRLVYRDNALVASEPGLGPQTAHDGPPAPVLPFDLSKNLRPVPEIATWAQSFGRPYHGARRYDWPRSARTDDGVTLHVVGQMPHITDADIAMLAGQAGATAVGDIVKANLALFESYGKIWHTQKPKAGRRRGDAYDHLLNISQAGALVKMLKERGAPQSAAARVSEIFVAYLTGRLPDLCSDPVQRGNAIAMEQARVGYVIDAHGYVHRTHEPNGRPLAAPYHLPPIQIDLKRVASHIDKDGRPVYLAKADDLIMSNKNGRPV